MYLLLIPCGYGWSMQSQPDRLSVKSAVQIGQKTVI